MKGGSCHCGKVVFNIGDPFSEVNYCYCETCRKLSGGACSVVARASLDEFKIIKGGGFLHTYESSPGKVR